MFLLFLFLSSGTLTIGDKRPESVLLNPVAVFSFAHFTLLAKYNLACTSETKLKTLVTMPG